MSTIALQNLWETLLGQGLSVSNKRWLAEHLWEQADREEIASSQVSYATTQEEAAELQPYTMEEIYAMIERSEADIAAGRVYTEEQVAAKREQFISQLLQR